MESTGYTIVVSIMIGLALSYFIIEIMLILNDVDNDNGLFPVLILFGLTIIMVIIGFKVPFEKTKSFLTAILIAGLLYGHFFWSMNYIIRP